MIDEIIRVTNVQRMCFHDGPGIRTTVFLKGCSLHCPWCSNPENIHYEKEKYCLNGVEGVYGRDYHIDELSEIVLKDKAFWGKDGGVTLSGGEPLLQYDGVSSFARYMKANNVNIAAETSCFAPYEYVTDLSDLIDFFIVDIKILDPEICKSILGGDIEIYLKNIEYLYNKRKLLWFRIPLGYEYTFNDRNIALILSFLKKYNGVPVQLFSIHNLGESKYRSLNRKVNISQKLSDVDLLKIRDIIVGSGTEAEIIRI